MQNPLMNLCAPKGLGQIHGGYVLKVIPDIADGDVAIAARSTTEGVDVFGTMVQAATQGTTTEAKPAQE